MVSFQHVFIFNMLNLRRLTGGRQVVRECHKAHRQRSTTQSGGGVKINAFRLSGSVEDLKFSLTTLAGNM